MTASAPDEGAPAPSNRNATLSTFLRYLFAVVLLGGIFGLVWALVPPNTKKVNIAAGVDTASLTRFALDTNNTLNYVLAFNLTLSNNRRWFDVYYKKLQARASYGGEEFASAALPAFSLPRGNNSTLSARFRGQTQMRGGQVAERFGREKGKGYYFVELQVDLEIRTEKFDDRRRMYRSRTVFAKVACQLKLSLASINGSMTMGFKRTECDVKFG